MEGPLFSETHLKGGKIAKTVLVTGNGWIIIAEASG